MFKQTPTPFSYFIGWSWLNRWYYGICFHTNFKLEQCVLEFKWLYGNPDVIEINQVFDSLEEAIEIEKEMNCSLSSIEGKMINTLK